MTIGPFKGEYRWLSNFWGDCTCEDCSGIVGENHLGKILMETRGIIRRFY